MKIGLLLAVLCGLGVLFGLAALLGAAEAGHDNIHNGTKGVGHTSLGICPSCYEPIQGGYCQNCGDSTGQNRGTK